MSKKVKFYYIKLKNNSLAYCFSHGDNVYYFDFFSLELDIDNLVKQDQILFVSPFENIAPQLVLLDFISARNPSIETPEKTMRYNEEEKKLEVSNKTMSHDATRKEILGSCDFEITSRMTADEILERLLVYSYGLLPGITTKIEEKYKYYLNYNGKEEARIEKSEVKKMFKDFFKIVFLTFSAKNGFRQERAKYKVTKEIEEGLEFVILFNDQLECEVYITAKWLLEYPFERLVDLNMQHKFPVSLASIKSKREAQKVFQYLLDILSEYYLPIFESNRNLESIVKTINNVQNHRALSEGALLFDYNIKSSKYDFYLATNQKEELIKEIRKRAMRRNVSVAYRLSVPSLIANIDAEITEMQDKINQPKVTHDFSYLDENKKLVPVKLTAAEEVLLQLEYCDWFVEVIASDKPLSYKISAISFYFTLEEGNPNRNKRNVITYLSLCLAVQEQHKEKVRRMLYLLKVEEMNFKQAPIETIERFKKMNAQFSIDSQSVLFYREKLTEVYRKLELRLNL